MTKSTFAEEQIAFGLTRAETRTWMAKVCRRLEISGQKLFCWKHKLGGLAESGFHRFRQSEEENRRLKRVAADLNLDEQML
jgi:putative transposase